MKFLGLIVLLLLTAGTPRGDFLFYIDSSKKSNVTLQLYGNNYVDYFGFIDTFSDGTYLSRVFLGKTLVSNIGVEAESFVADFHIIRGGFTYSAPLKAGFLKARLYPLSQDQKDGLVGLVWSYQLGRFVIDGFADYSFRGKWVAEPQIRYMLTKQLGLALEGRIDQFARNQNIGLGVNYSW